MTPSPSFTTSLSSHALQQEIQLSDMLAVDPPADVSSSSLFKLSPPHVFEIVTAETTYFCGIDLNDADVKDVQVIATGTIVDHSTLNGMNSFLAIITVLHVWGVYSMCASSTRFYLHLCDVPLMLHPQ